MNKGLRTEAGLSRKVRSILSFQSFFFGGDIVHNQPAYQPYSLRCGGEVMTGKSGRYEKKVYVFGFFCVTL